MCLILSLRFVTICFWKSGFTLSSSGNLVFPRMFWPDCATRGENVTVGEGGWKDGGLQHLPTASFQKQGSLQRLPEWVLLVERGMISHRHVWTLRAFQKHKLFLIVKLLGSITRFSLWQRWGNHTDFFEFWVLRKECDFCQQHIYDSNERDWLVVSTELVMSLLINKSIMCADDW